MEPSKSGRMLGVMGVQLRTIDENGVRTQSPIIAGQGTEVVDELQRVAASQAYIDPPAGIFITDSHHKTADRELVWRVFSGLNHQVFNRFLKSSCEDKLGENGRLERGALSHFPRVSIRWEFLWEVLRLLA